jgi:(p)ppGpp synthase/HD superfamily hydrolase
MAGSTLTPRFAEAFALALGLHGGQMRKQAEEETEEAAIPYLAHLMSVAALVLEHGGDEDEAIAALLHDGPEDQGGRATLERIRERFGDRVAEIVEGCSDTFEHPKPKWKPRKRKYLEHLSQGASDSVFLVSLADKVHNLRSILADQRRIGGKVWERFSGRRKGTLWYYRKLLKIYREEAPPRCKPLVKEMQRTLLQVRARG